ncbi:MAG: bifunctional riboflavin kinase/FAD synthetase [Actinomycetota bacterium]
MEIVRGLDALPPDGAPSVVTVGFFDGVHVGHRAVLRKAVATARDRGLGSAAITFDRHPREVLTPEKAPRLLTGVERKGALIEETGVDVLLVLEFTEEFSRWPAEDFVRRVLVDSLHAEHVVTGADFRFGQHAAGNSDVLVDRGRSLGFTAERVELVELDGRRVSSSSIRDALAEGDLAWPTKALGRRFVLDGTVVPGAGRGHGLGYPTANLRTWPRLLLPGRGIYAGRAKVDGVERLAAIDVGTNPTFGTEPLHAEAYLLDFDGDLVGCEMAIEFWTRLRDEERFDTLEDLAAAMAEDVRRTREIVRLDQGRES